MQTSSGLAAVHAAVNPAAIPPQPATSAAPSPAPATAAPATTIAELASAYPDLCAQLRAEGAATERARIVGIEAHAMPGHEALIAACKADPACTPDMAAGKIIVAEKALRENALGAIKGIETVASAVRAAPAGPAAPAAALAATTPDGWRAEYAAQTPAGAQLRADFASADNYVAFKANESKVRILGPRK